MIRLLPCAAVVLACSSSSSSSSPSSDDDERAPADQAAAVAIAPPIDAAPAPTFNQRVVALARAYPDGGGYAWPAPAGTHGTGRDLFVDGEPLARAAGDGSTHCSGITFELFWRALEDSPARPPIDAATARDLMRRWFVPTDGGMGPAEALVAHGLGVRIDDLDDARPGDFVQVWMHNGRGHTAVFLGWERDRDGRIVGLRHFSSHPATGGAGETTRAIGDGPRDIRRDAIYIARAEW